MPAGSKRSDAQASRRLDSPRLEGESLCPDFIYLPASEFHSEIFPAAQAACITCDAPAAMVLLFWELFLRPAPGRMRLPAFSAPGSWVLRIVPPLRLKCFPLFYL